MRGNGEPLPTTVSVGGQAVEMRRLLESYRFDQRAALPAIVAHISTIERPLMCGAALSLL